MDKGLQNTHPSMNILPHQVQKSITPKKPVNYINIILIASLILLFSSTAILAYQNLKNNQIIITNGLQDYFNENTNSLTLPKILQTQRPIPTPTSAAVEAAIAQQLQEIQQEAIDTARDKALAEINAATTEAATSIGLVETNELDKQISFIVPKNFSKVSVLDEINMPAISIKSADFKHSADLNFASGVYIVIFKRKVDSNYQISNEDNETNRKYLTNFKITTLGGKPAAYGFLEFETYSDRYFILNNSERWSIYIGYGGKNLQEALLYKSKYKNEIDQFINSISFK